MFNLLGLMIGIVIGMAGCIFLLEYIDKHPATEKNEKDEIESLTKFIDVVDEFGPESSQVKGMLEDIKDDKRLTQLFLAVIRLKATSKI